jgi:uncharacterized protein (DUF427 family)
LIEMMQATWKGVVLAESDDTVVIDGNHYFPLESVRMEYFSPSQLRTTCPWKGQAKYYTVTVGDAVNRDAAWYYPSPSRAAAEIRGRVAFWKGVSVRRQSDEPSAGWFARLTHALRG